MRRTAHDARDPAACDGDDTDADGAVATRVILVAGSDSEPIRGGTHRVVSERTSIAATAAVWAQRGAVDDYHRARAGDV